MCLCVCVSACVGVCVCVGVFVHKHEVNRIIAIKYMRQSRRIQNEMFSGSCGDSSGYVVKRKGIEQGMTQGMADEEEGGKGE